MLEVITIGMLPVLHFVGDALYDEGRKQLSSYFKSAFLLGVCFITTYEPNIWYIPYLLLCWYVCEVIYNKIRKLGWFYVGKTKWEDRLLRFLADTNKLTRGHYEHISFITKLMAVAGIFGLFYTGRL